MKRIAIILTLIFGFASSAGAYVASSTNYRIDVDSINISGGESTSTSYKINDTVGEIGTGDSTSTSYNIDAGYQAMVGSEVTLTLSSPADVTLSPSITQGEASNGQAAWTVTTNNSAGYSLSVKAATSPALQSSGNSLADYSPSGGADFTWTVASGSALFGFSPEGDDITSTYKDNGSSCGTGSSDTTNACWNGFSTTNQTISSKSSAASAGSLTTLKMRAEIGSSATATAGSYSAAITATAVAL